MDINGAKHKLEKLKRVGIKLAIDDFGTGHSSLAYLKHLPVDTIKIDRSFIQDIQSEPVDAIIVETTIAMGEKLGFSVVAEGIEDEQTYNLLRDFGCDIAQGYYLGHPVPFENFQNLLPSSSKKESVSLKN